MIEPYTFEKDRKIIQTFLKMKEFSDISLLEYYTQKYTGLHQKVIFTDIIYTSGRYRDDVEILRWAMKNYERICGFKCRTDYELFQKKLK
jgi:hypothetical protein